MKTLGIKELTEHINEILRMVEEDGETVEVINRGKIIARLVPANQSQHTATQDTNNILTNLNRLAEELAPYWPEDVDAVDAVHDVRREL